MIEMSLPQAQLQLQYETLIDQMLTLKKFWDLQEADYL